MIFLFTDMFQTSKNEEELFDALRHLKYNKHEVVLFHVLDAKTELNFDFDSTPKKFVDVETGETLSLFSDQMQEQYQDLVQDYVKALKNSCLQYGIDYVPVDIAQGFDSVLTSYLISRQKML